MILSAASLTPHRPYLNGVKHTLTMPAAKNPEPWKICKVVEYFTVDNDGELGCAQIGDCAAELHRSDFEIIMLDRG